MAKPTMTQAVKELWDASTSQLPKLYNEDLPEDAPEPPAAYFLHNGEATGRGKYPTGATKPTQRDGAFDIVLFAYGVDTVEALALLVLQLITVDSLALDNSQTTSTWQTNYQVRGTNWRDANGNQVYMATLSYACYIGNPSA